MRRALVVLLPGLLAGCTHYEPLTLSGAASMRVEVEVYKGPLTAPITGQVAELVGVVSDVVRDMDRWRDQVEAACAQEAPQHWREGCRDLRGAYGSARTVVAAACVLLASPALTDTVGRAVYIPMYTCDETIPGVKEFSKSLQAGLEKTTPNSAEGQVSGSNASDKARQPLDADLQKHFDLLIKEVNDCQGKAQTLYQRMTCQKDFIGVAFDNLSAIVSGAGRRASDQLVGHVPVDPDARRHLVEFASMADQYGEQIHARITVLEKEMEEDAGPRDTRMLPVSDYLRGASRTDYVELYDWLNAGDTPANESAPPLNTAERVRMAQRLTADAYWQKINEVYTSGQGDVAMAFIKDDLGNWDLKSFSNDPSDLLAAYRGVTNAALKTAVKLATKASGAGSALEASDRLTSAGQAAALANQLATGETPGTPATVAGMDVTKLHGRTSDRIAAQKARFDAREAALNADVATQKKAVADLQAAKPALDTTANTDNTDVDTKAATLKQDQAALDKAKTDGSDAAAIAAKQGQVAQDQSALTDAQAKAKTAKDAVDKNKADTDAALIAQKASEGRLADLPKEAVEDIRATMDDHLAVVSALQDGITSAATPAKPSATTPAVVTVPAATPAVAGAALAARP